MFDNKTNRTFTKQRGTMNPLTRKQKEILEYIRGFIDENGYAPSYREIAHYFEFSSTGTVAEYISILEEKGYLTKDAMEARAIQLTPSFDTGLELCCIPLEGVIDAGRPIEAIRTHETIDIPRDMMGRKTFALRVRGESMIDDGILDGDYVIIELTNLARDGDIVVALVDNENATLKRFYNEKNNIRLQPANKLMKPMRFAKKRITVQGKVKGVIRKFNK
jgi:repressor LexA